MAPAKLQPALLAGLAIGVLTALPVINIVNLCCCAWVVFGGALAAYLMQQNHPAPVTSGDGAIVGLMAGAAGAVIGTIISIPIHLAMGPFSMEMVDRVLQSAEDMPPEARAIIEQWRNSVGSGAAMMGAGLVIGMLFSLCFYSIFGLLGGLLGAVMFKKNMPPPPPPASPLVPPMPPISGPDQSSYSPPPPPPVT